MSEETLEPLSAAELAEIDARYVPFPAFDEWPQQLPEAELWQRSRDAFQAAADEATEDDLRRAQAVARRIAAFDTGAIEGLYSTNRGLTFTVAEQAAAWERQVDAQGAEARALFEAQLRTFELVLDHVTDRFPMMTQAWLRRLHEEITMPQETYVVHTPVGSQKQPLPKGEYKTHPNHVRAAGGEIHAYAPVGSTQAEMQRLIAELETPEFETAHPVIQASYAHYALVAVHPFADGNGRVARAAASVYTYQDASIPILVLNEHRSEYFAALAEADRGEPSAFVGFTARVVREALELVRDNLRTAMAPQPDLVLDEFETLLGTKLHGELDGRAAAFVEWLQTTAKDQIAILEVPAGVEMSVEHFDDSLSPPSGYRDILAPGPKGIRLNLKTLPPAETQVLVRIDVFVSASSDSTDCLLIQAIRSEEERLALSRSEMLPQLSAAAQLRVENLLRRLIGEGLEDLLQQAQKRLQG